MRRTSVSIVAVAVVLASCGRAERESTFEARPDPGSLVAMGDDGWASTTTLAPPTSPPPTALAVPPAAAGASAPSLQTAARPARQRPAPAPVVKQPPPRPNRSTDTASAPPPPPPTSTAVYPGDFPDPFVVRAGPYWYAYATQRGLAQVPVLRSADLVHWEERGDALPRLPSWAKWGFVWAPSALPRDTGGFVLYYTTREAATDLQCVSRAVSVLPEGPYIDTSAGPLVCQRDRGGSIDPSPFVAADGSRWLVWKSEGTLDGEQTRIWSAPLVADGTALAGEPTELLHTEQTWEVPIIEAPSMIVEGGRYHLMFSGNRWETGSYAVGHAVCAAPAGPCTRSSPSPVLATGGGKAGPGGAEVFRDVDGSLLLAHHAWDASAVGYPGGARRLYIDRLRLDGTVPSVEPRAAL